MGRWTTVVHRKPNFLVIGAPKAGTTSLCSYLAQHPDIFISDPKEPHFFCDDRLYERGLKWYESLFAAGADKKLRGEGTPFYSLTRTFPQVLPRIQEDLDDIKIIYMVRHPLARMESYYSQEIHNGYEVPHFCEAVRTRPHYVDGSLYYEHYREYCEAFGRERVHVIFFEEFRRNTSKTMQRLFDFLEVETPQLQGDYVQQNARNTHREDTAVLRIIRRMPGFRYAERYRKALLPKTIRQILKTTLRRRPTQSPTWDDSTHRWAVAQLANDSAHFLQGMNKPLDYWGEL